METFKIISSQFEFKEVQGERCTIEIGGKVINCFAYRDDEETEHGIVEGYCVSEIETGVRICNGFTIKSALEKGHKLFNRAHNPLDKLKELLTYKGFKLPINI